MTATVLLALLVAAALYGAAMTGAYVVVLKSADDITAELHDTRALCTDLEAEVEQLRRTATKPGDTPEYDLLAQERVVGAVFRRIADEQRTRRPVSIVRVAR